MCDYDANKSSVVEEGSGKDEASENIEKNSLDEMNEHIQNVLQQMKEKFQSMSEHILAKIDDMGSRIDDLEKNISDLMNQAGIEPPSADK